MSLLPPPDPATMVHDRFIATGTPRHAMTVGGSPTPQEVAAIMAAVEHVWPRPMIVLPDKTRTTPAWRFSGRWWSRPSVTRRDRPWVG